MTTPPIPAAIVAKIKKRQQSVRWEATLREVVQFRAYCCNIDSDDIMGVSKEPVPVFKLTPKTICLGNSVAWDFTGSYAPGSTITSRAIDWGNGDTEDPAANTGTYTYGAEGSYTVTATVTEGLGTSQSIEVEVNVIDCSAFLLGKYAYAGLYGGGVWYREASGDWEQRNTGLGAGLWWLTDTVDNGDIEAIYQPIGAASLADSYVNLSNPGTNDATPGTAPTWAAGTGWTFDGATTYLETGLTPASDWTILVRVAFDANMASERGIVSSRATNADFGVNGTISLIPGPSRVLQGHWHWAAGSYNAVSVGVGGLGRQDGVIILAANNAYSYNQGIGLEFELAISSTFSGSPVELYIGAENNGGAANFYSEDILAVAIANRELNATELDEIAANMMSIGETDNPDALFVNYLIQRPGQQHLNAAVHELWAATDDGLYHTTNGGQGWDKIDLPDPSNAEFGDVPAATVDQLRFIWVGYDPTDTATLYLEGVTDSPARIWMYKTTDSGTNWTSRGVTV